MDNQIRCGNQDDNPESILLHLRLRAARLEQLDSDMTDLLYDLLLLALTHRSQLARRASILLVEKILALPLGVEIAHKLLVHDEQWGCPLQNYGVDLQRWIKERREKDARQSSNDHDSSSTGGHNA